MPDEETKGSEETKDEKSGGSEEKKDETTGSETETDSGKDEVTGLKRDLAEARKKVKEAEKAAKDAAEAEAKEKGKWEELAKQRGDELEKAETRAAEAERKSTVEKIARRLDFKNPGIAHRLLDSDVDDESAIERELKRLAEEEDYLVGKEQKGSRSAGSGKSKGKADMDSLIRSKRR